MVPTVLYRSHIASGSLQIHRYDSIIALAKLAVEHICSALAHPE